MTVRCIAGILLAICTGSVQGGGAQSVVRLNGRRLRLGTDSLAIYVVRGSDTVRTGTVLDNLSVAGDRLVRVYASDDRLLGTRLDTIMSALPDLRPISYWSHSSQLVAHLNYDAAGVAGWLRLVSGDSVPVHVALPVPVYDGADFDLVVRASGLRDGLQLSVPSFLVGSNTVGTLEGRVSGSAVIDGRPCWVFRAHFESLPVTFWIDKDTRALRRQLLELQVGTSLLFALPHPSPSGRPS